jgi:hypothetical protein
MTHPVAQSRSFAGLASTGKGDTCRVSCSTSVNSPYPSQARKSLSNWRRLVKFRDEIETLGLTWTYPTHSEFGERVRGGLLRAIRDILQEESRTPQEHPE